MMSLTRALRSALVFVVRWQVMFQGDTLAEVLTRL